MSDMTKKAEKNSKKPVREKAKTVKNKIKEELGAAKNNLSQKDKYKLEELFVLFVSVPKGKKDVIADLLEQYDVTAALSVLAKGTSDVTMTKEMVFCVIKKTMLKDAMLILEDKFKTFHGNYCMAYSVPLKNIIGVSNYMFLSNGGK